MGLFDDTVGAFLIGVIFSVFLGGITAAQSFTYYESEHRRSDKAVYRWIVAFLFVIDIFHSAIVCHTIYHWTVTNFANPAALAIMPWTFYIEPALVGLVAVVCQSFFAYRVFIVSGRKAILPALIVFLSVLSAGFALATTIWAKVVIDAQLARSSEFKWGVSMWLLSAALTDLLITGSLIYYLRKAGSKAGEFANRSSTIVDKILRNTIETNGLTLVVAVIDAILYLVLPNTAWHVVPNFMLPKLLTNSVLVSLNSRGALASAHLTQSRSTPASSPLIKPGLFSFGRTQPTDENKHGVSHISFTKHQVTHTESVGDSDVKDQPEPVHPFARSGSLASMNKEKETAIELGAVDSSPKSHNTVRGNTSGAAQASWK